LSVLSSCSSVESINNNALDVADIARSSLGRFETISQEARITGFVDEELILRESLSGIEEQERIINHVNDIIKEIPNIEDSIPWWANLIQWGFISLAVVGSFVLLWYLGLGYPIKAIMRRFASLIPARKKEAAKLLYEAQSPNSDTTVNEAVAVLRATDKDFDAAYKRQAKENK